MSNVLKPKIRVIIVDDEPLARSNISTLLAEDSEVEIIGECGSGTEAVESISRLRPDLLFLDVQMPGCDGFDVLENLGTSVPRVVIFVTAYDQYALKAFEAEALDYLLKPFDDARFSKTLERGKGIVREGRRQPSRLMLKSSGKVTVISTEDIDWVEAADYYACLHVKGKSHLIRRSLTDLESELDATHFSRIHRSTIVNLERVSEITADTNGDYQVVLSDGTRVRLSRGYREQLQSRLRALTQSLNCRPYKDQQRNRLPIGNENVNADSHRFR
jgi:two-component system LytT family response regulator